MFQSSLYNWGGDYATSTLLAPHTPHALLSTISTAAPAQQRRATWQSRLQDPGVLEAASTQIECDFDQATAEHAAQVA